MKQVKIYTTASGNGKIIETSATTFGELMVDMMQNGVDFNIDSMKAIVGETKNVLEIESALLPEGNFGLFLFPKKTKSGLDCRYSSRAELEEAIKQLRLDYPEISATYFLGFNCANQSITSIIVKIENFPYPEKEKCLNIVSLLEKRIEAQEKKMAILTAVLLKAHEEGEDYVTDLTTALNNEAFFSGIEIEEEKVNQIQPEFQEMVKEADDLAKEFGY